MCVNFVAVEATLIAFNMMHLLLNSNTRGDIDVKTSINYFQTQLLAMQRTLFGRNGLTEHDIQQKYKRGGPYCTFC